MMHLYYSGFGSELVSIMFDNIFKVLIIQHFIFVGFSIFLISRIGKILSRMLEALKKRGGMQQIPR